jgi:hypothetical protein
MRGLAGRLAILLVLGLAAFGSARAADIACPPNYQASTVRCVDPSSSYCARPAGQLAPGERLTCEYAMLNVAYERIYSDQQRMLHAGTLSTADLAAWRRKRNACETVSCVDAVFADWRRMAVKRPAEHPVPPKATVSTESRSPATAPAPVAPPPIARAPHPMPSAAPLVPATVTVPTVPTVATALTPPTSPPAPAASVRSEPAALSISVVRVHSTGNAAPWLLAWLILPVAILCMLAWTLAHGRARAAAPVRVRSLVGRVHHMSHAAVVLGTLAVVNGILLVMVLTS